MTDILIFIKVLLDHPDPKVNLGTRDPQVKSFDRNRFQTKALKVSFCSGVARGWAVGEGEPRPGAETPNSGLIRVRVRS